MALLFQEQKDGIQLGKSLDKCFMCEKEARKKRETIQDGVLEHKEVFLLNINGLRQCLCMEHFNSLLGEYNIIPKSEYEQLHSLLNQVNDISQEDKAEEKETEENEKEKQSAKNTKAAKSSKGK